MSMACRKPPVYDHTTMVVDHFMVVFDRYVTDLQLEGDERITAMLTFLAPTTLKNVLQIAPELGVASDMGWHSYRDRFIQVIESLKREQALTARMSLKNRTQKTGETVCEFAQALTDIAEEGWPRAEDRSAREFILKQTLISGAKNYWVRVWLIQNQEKYSFREIVAEANAVEISHTVQGSDKGEAVEVSVLQAQANEPPITSIPNQPLAPMGPDPASSNAPRPPYNSHSYPAQQLHSQTSYPGQQWMAMAGPPWTGMYPPGWNMHVRCYNCRNLGHHARNCPHPRLQQDRYQGRNQQYHEQLSRVYGAYNNGYDTGPLQKNVNATQACALDSYEPYPCATSVPRSYPMPVGEN